MPTVNTLVVDRADLLGLGQLHQLRGRVGRAGQRAYAYLFIPPDRVAHRGGLRAAARPSARPPSSGSGFKIAMRDLEIRGAGNLLGAGQIGPHRRGRLRPLLPDGHRGGGRAEGRGGPRSRPRSSSTCPSTPTCPRDYVRKRGAAARGLPPPGRGHRPTAEVDDIRAEWEDRYGPVPAAGRGAARRRPGCGPSARAPASGRSPSPRARASAARSTSPGSAPSRCRRRKTIRLERLYKGSVYKADQGQLQLPLKTAAGAAQRPRGRPHRPRPARRGRARRRRRVDCHRLRPLE